VTAFVSVIGCVAAARLYGRRGGSWPKADISRLALLQRNSKAEVHPEGRKIFAANASQSYSW